MPQKKCLKPTRAILWSGNSFGTNSWPISRYSCVRIYQSPRIVPGADFEWKLRTSLNHAEMNSRMSEKWCWSNCSCKWKSGVGLDQPAESSMFFGDFTIQLHRCSAKLHPECLGHPVANTPCWRGESWHLRGSPPVPTAHISLGEMCGGEITMLPLGVAVIKT